MSARINEDLTQLNSNLEKHTLDTPVEITNYDGSTDSKIFICPSDGYIRGLVSYHPNQYIKVDTYSPSVGWFDFLRVANSVNANSSTNTLHSVFVRKGTKVRVSKQQSTNGTVTASFSALV